MQLVCRGLIFSIIELAQDTSLPCAFPFEQLTRKKLKLVCCLDCLVQRTLYYKNRLLTPALGAFTSKYSRDPYPQLRPFLLSSFTLEVKKYLIH